jgi:serine/threonine protein kinase
MSPEQASGGALDSRSDIYPPGIVLYQMLARRVPLEDSDGSVGSVLEDHQLNSPPTIPNVSPPCKRLSLGPFPRTLVQDTAGGRTGRDPRRCNQPRQSRILMGPLNVTLVVRGPAGPCCISDEIGKNKDRPLI